ncbi:hypothetical protein U1Q18_009546, partial [Sarracenia purpurea var. burkii]
LALSLVDFLVKLSIALVGILILVKLMLMPVLRSPWFVPTTFWARPDYLQNRDLGVAPVWCRPKILRRSSQFLFI